MYRGRNEISNSYVKQGFTDRGPTGPNRSEIFKILLVLVRSGTNQFWSVDPRCQNETNLSIETKIRNIKLEPK